jgi:hypothetical protein
MRLVLLLLLVLACAGARAARAPARAQHVLADVEEAEPEPPVWPKSFEVS